MECLSHKAATTAPSRGQAWRTAAQPESFCSKCVPIAKGKADRVMTGDKVAIPTPRRNGGGAKKAAAKRQPTKKAATGKASR